MLGRLTAKFGATAFHSHAVCADVRYLPFRNQFELAMMPFHSFAELTGGTGLAPPCGTVR